MPPALSFLKSHATKRGLLAMTVLILTFFNMWFSFLATPFFVILDSSRDAPAFSIFNVDDQTGRWPVKGLRLATMTPEESVHYALDTVAGDVEWKSTLPRGRGVIHLQQGATKTAYRLAMFHQLECLNVIRTEMLERRAHPTVPPSDKAHFCLNYLRQSITCHADPHLEMVRSEYGGRAVLPYTTRTDCVDWEMIWNQAEENYDSHK